MVLEATNLGNCHFVKIKNISITHKNFNFLQISKLSQLLNLFVVLDKLISQQLKIKCMVVESQKNINLVKNQ